MFTAINTNPIDIRPMPSHCLGETFSLKNSSPKMTTGITDAALITPTYAWFGAVTFA